MRGLAEAPPLPLFAAAETNEAAVALPPMGEARAVVEDYRSTGVTLRRHPVSFLREQLATRRILPCAALDQARDGAWVTVAGLVLVRQRPGSARGVLFVTLEDETGIANLIVWPSLFERQRRIVLSAGMLACRGRVQKEGLVIHVLAERLQDLSPLLRSLGQSPLPVPHGRGDQATHGAGPDPRDGPRPRDIYIPDLRLGSGIKVPTRDFR